MGIPKPVLDRTQQGTDMQFVALQSVRRACRPAAFRCTGPQLSSSELGAQLGSGQRGD
jgi:hypothetical protein